MSSNFNTGRNSEVQGYMSRDYSPEGSIPKKAPMKLGNKLKNNLMIDANATFVAGVGMGMGTERSRSGIGGNMHGIISPLATNGFGQFNVFNTTVQG